MRHAPVVLTPGLLDATVEIVRRAGGVIEAVRHGALELGEKAHGAGPVTRADREADALLRAELGRLVPGAGWLSEETADDASRLSCRDVWIVDPLDGTREFVEGIPEYAVAVGLVSDGSPVLGVVYNPATGEMVAGCRGAGVTRNGARAAAAGSRRLLASRSEIRRGEFVPFGKEWDLVAVGSIQYKLALVAAGKAGLTLSRGPKHEWDVCAGAFLVAEAGGVVTDVRGRPLVFNQARPKVPGVLAGAPEPYRQALAQVEEIGVSDRMAELDS